jgi:hypothetical protein
MKFYKKLAVTVSSIIVSLSFQANAATTFTPDLVLDTATTPNPPVLHLTSVGTTGWVSPSMSYKGWTHQSKWLFLNVMKDKTVTINLDAVTPNGGIYTGFHPGLTVWNRTTKLPVTIATNYWMDDHFYKQGASINVSNAKADTAYALNGQTVAAGDSVGNIIMEYVTSAYDANGLGDKFAVDSTTGMLKPATTETSFYGPYLPIGYSVLGTSTGLTTAAHCSDSTKTTAATCVSPATWYTGAGVLTTSFTAAKTGIYQIVVGGLKPDTGSLATTFKGSCSDASKTTQATCLSPALWITPNNMDVTITVK